MLKNRVINAVTSAVLLPRDLVQNIKTAREERELEAAAKYYDDIRRELLGKAANI